MKLKSILLSTLTGWIVRLLAIGLNLIGYRIIFEHLGEEKLGLFLILSGIVSWIVVADLNISRTITRFATRKWKDDLRFVGSVFTHGVIITFAISAVLFVVFTSVALTAPWTRLINGLNDQNKNEFVAALILLGALLSISRFLSPFEGMRAATHNLYVINLWRAGGYAIAFGALFGLISPTSSLIAIVLTLSGGAVLADAGHAISLVASRGGLLRTDVKFRKIVVKAILSDSLLNIISTISFVLVYQFSVSLIGFATGPIVTVVPGAAMRVLMTLLALEYALLFPMWSAVSAALGQRDRKRAETVALYSGIAITLSGVIGVIAILLFGEFAISLWLGGPIEFNLSLRVAFSVLVMSALVHQYLMNLLYGLGQAQTCAIVFSVEAALGVGGGYLLTLKYGPIAMMYSIAAAQCLIGAPIFCYTALSALRKIKRIERA